MSLQRLRNEFQFAIVTLFGVVGVLGILPFSFYRFANGQRLAGTVDLLIVLAIAAVVVWVWRGGSVRRAGQVVVVSNSIGCVAMALLAGLPGMLWTYPLLMANFLLVSRVQAVLASTALVALLVLHGGPFDGTVEKAMFAATALVVSAFAYVFAHRTEQQRLQLETLAVRDPLTGIPNRRAMEQSLLHAIQAHAQDGSPMGLAMLDLDRFKAVNDSHGHEAGDTVLVAFVHLVQEVARRSDRLFRYGGEEFVLLLPGADSAALATVCEKLRAHVEAHLACDGTRVTVSIGAAELRAGEERHAWLGRADAALYEGKARGRNCVVVAASG